MSSTPGRRSSATPESRWWFSTMSTVGSAVVRSTRDWTLLRRSPSTILVQYVPTGFGLRGANIPWCRWLLERSRRPGSDVRVMFHEPYFEFTWSAPPAERARTRRAVDGEDTAPRRLARVRVDRRVAPLPGAAHAGRSGRRTSSRCRFRRRFRAAIASLTSPIAARSCWGPPRAAWSATSARLARRSRRCSKAALTQAVERRSANRRASASASGSDEFVRSICRHDAGNRRTDARDRPRLGPRGGTHL